MEVRTIPRVLHNEVVLLVALSVAAFGVFVFTRHMSAREQRLEARIAAIWYERGEQFIAAGDVEKAIQAFRRATADSHDNQKYMLALANALTLGHHDAEAQQLLLQLRESDPEDAEINISLARLAAKHGDTDEAVHYYQNALYGRWSGDHVDEQRGQLRKELIHFLLRRQQRELAASELLILEAGLPDSAASHVEIAKLFVDAGDLQHALKNYSEAAQRDNHNLEAQAGAGEISFQLGNYAGAIPYLKAALELDPQSQKTRPLLETAELVLAEDPLASHLSPQERQDRILADLDRSLKRLDSCPEPASSNQASSEMQSLKAEALALQPKLNSRKHPPDSDAAKSALGLIYRMQKASAHCGEPAAADQALLLIGRQHNGVRP